jgi:3',5'-cyclic AMP phosphodiesterase CpdA
MRPPQRQPQPRTNPGKTLDPAGDPGQVPLVFTLAHLSDTHLGELGLPRLDLLLSKRLLGLLSWHLRRKAIHEGPVLAALVTDLHAARPDHTVVTGDLVNISLPEEFARAAVWLKDLGPPWDVSVIPGNHDAYVPIAWDRSLALWADYMSSDGADGRAHPAAGPADFPFLRRRGPLAIVGVTTAAPMPPHSAAGRIGADQMGRLAGLLAQTRQEESCRVVLIHHPPLPGPAADRKQLLDSAPFRAVIAAEGAELILHGHTHCSGLAQLPAPNGSVPVVGVPSASARPSHKKDHARYHLYRITREGADWRIGVDVRGMDNGHDHFSPENGFTLNVAR